MRTSVTPRAEAAALATILMLACSPGAAHAGQTASQAKPEATARTESAPPPAPVDLQETRVSRKQALTLDGVRLPYTVTAGTLVLRDDAGKARASIFYVAYTRDGVDAPAARPVTFSFNGGPGSAAVWVQLGAFGPRKVRMTDEGWPLAPPGTLVDNTHSVLDVTDLVFIDPVGTGFSRPAPGVEAKAFHGLRPDIESVGDFIRLWTARHGRWASPKFVAGESYGTTRAAGLALYLQQRHGLYLNGLVMISTILNWQNEEIHPGNDTAYVIHLPSYVAAAWYHKKLAPELQADLRRTLTEAEAFAIGEYASALVRGDWLPDAERHAVAAKLARYTGLDAEYLLRANLRIGNERFTKELLRDRGLTLGRLDMRFTGRDRDAAGERTEFDPAGEAVNVGYVALLNDYLRREVGYETELAYEFSASLWRNWTWEPFTNRYVNVSEDLRQAMTRNPSLRVLFCSGYYDLATPYFDTPFSVAHLGLPPELRGNASIAYYEAGHMMYIREADHAKFKQDVAAFIRAATTGASRP